MVKISNRIDKRSKKRGGGIMERQLSIKKTPKIELGKNQTNTIKIEDPLVETVIETFTSVLEANIKGDSLNLFHENIATLEIEIEKSLKRYIYLMLKEGSLAGSYDIVHNRVYALPCKNKSFLNYIMGVSKEEHIATLIHELLHMSATILGYYNGINFSGFSQKSKDGTYIGLALDDGYVDALLYRLFSTNIKYIKYKYEFNIARNIERIVGRNRMMNEFFTANLYDLIGSLERYSSINEIENFIVALDTIYQISYGNIGTISNRELMHYHNDVSDFLVKTYQTKIDRELSRGLITMQIHDQKFAKCLRTLDRAYDSLGASSKTLSRRR